MQKHVNLVDLVKSFPTNILLQKSVSIQPRTSHLLFIILAASTDLIFTERSSPPPPDTLGGKCSLASEGLRRRPCHPAQNHEESIDERPTRRWSLWQTWFALQNLRLQSIDCSLDSAYYDRLLLIRQTLKVPPVLNRLVLFFSDWRNPHEVPPDYLAMFSELILAPGDCCHRCTKAFSVFPDCIWSRSREKKENSEYFMVYNTLSCLYVVILTRLYCN